MATILFYTSIKTRVRDQESLMVECVRQGHEVYFLNKQNNPYLPAICEIAGVKYYEIRKISSSSTLVQTIYYCFQLISFIWRNKINIVFSHLEPANFIAVLIQFFVRARVIIVRHHHDLAELIGFAKDLSYRLTYKLAQDIIAVSERTRNYMINKEGISAKKIHTINLGYDFSIFGEPNEEKVNEISKRLNGVIKLITVGRLDKYKRPEVSIELLKKIIDSGVKAHLYFLGTGELNSNLVALLKKYDLEDQVEFLGYENDVLTYLKASDWLIHPSISESSCVVVKEAGLVELPAIVCKGVGDFDDYLKNEVNSFLVNRDKFAEESFHIVMNNRNSVARTNIGKALGCEIRSRFHISSIVREYERFIEN